jgi:hypothetical protein
MMHSQAPRLPSIIQVNALSVGRAAHRFRNMPIRSSVCLSCLRQLNQRLGLGARNEHARAHAEHEMQPVRRGGQILQRHAVPKPPLPQLLKHQKKVPPESIRLPEEAHTGLKDCPERLAPAHGQAHQWTDGQSDGETDGRGQMMDGRADGHGAQWAGRQTD